MVAARTSQIQAPSAVNGSASIEAAPARSATPTNPIAWMTERAAAAWGAGSDE